MNVWPNASDQTEHFRFESGDCLYRDHRGHRVLADWEGPGTLHIIRCEFALHINGSLNRGVLFPYSFEGPVTISTNEEGTFEAVITRSTGTSDTELRISEESSVITKEETWVHEFPKVPQELARLWMCGFVLHSRMPFRIDDNNCLDSVVAGIPVPFFQSLETHEGMEVLLNGDIHSMQLCYFAIADVRAISDTNWSAQNLSAPHFFESQYEDGTKHSANVASLLNACSFDVSVPSNCVGLRISKTYDQFHGRQCARVWCDDDFKGLWYLPRQNRVQRWAKAWFGFEMEPASEEKTVRVTMDPPGGTPMWSMSEISVVGLVLNG